MKKISASLLFLAALALPLTAQTENANPWNASSPLSPFYGSTPVMKPSDPKAKIPAYSPSTSNPSAANDPSSPFYGGSSSKPFGKIDVTSPFYQTGTTAPTMHPLYPSVNDMRAPYSPRTSSPSNPNDPTSPFYNPTK